MAHFRKGDRVIASRNLGLFGYVRQGTEGVAISEPGLFGYFDVDFDGYVVNVSERDVARVAAMV